MQIISVATKWNPVCNVHVVNDDRKKNAQEQIVTLRSIVLTQYWSIGESINEITLMSELIFILTDSFDVKP